MGALQSIQTIRKISFEDIIDTVFKNKHGYLLINTLPITEQTCLITGTTIASHETEIVNGILNTNKAHPIIIYGKNTHDHSILVKYEQLERLGFSNIYVYPGGMFEWLLLQEIYGLEMFPTTCHPKQIDIYQFRPAKTLNRGLIA